jgi:RNA polymerase sigma-70 factor (ECF subfamily)
MMPIPPPTETILRATHGSTQAFREVVEWLQPYAYSVACRFTGDADDAEDIVQEAFVRLWRHLPDYKPEIKLTTWLYRIVVNLCFDFLKSRHRRQQKNRIGLVDGHDVADPGTPEKELQQRELVDAIHRACETLPPKQRAVFILRDLEGLSAQEACEALSMDPGTLKSNLFYARRQMGEKLRTLYQDNTKHFSP